MNSAQYGHNASEYSSTLTFSTPVSANMLKSMNDSTICNEHQRFIVLEVDEKNKSLNRFLKNPLAANAGQDPKSQYISIFQMYKHLVKEAKMGQFRDQVLKQTPLFGQLISQFTESLFTKMCHFKRAGKRSVGVDKSGFFLITQLKLFYALLNYSLICSNKAYTKVGRRSSDDCNYIINNLNHELLDHRKI